MEVNHRVHARRVARISVTRDESQTPPRTLRGVYFHRLHYDGSTLGLSTACSLTLRDGFRPRHDHGLLGKRHMAGGALEWASITQLAADGHASDGAGCARAFYWSVRSRSTRYADPSGGGYIARTACDVELRGSVEEREQPHSMPSLRLLTRPACETLERSLSVSDVRRKISR